MVALSKISSTITKGLSNPKVQKFLLYVLLILVAVYILSRSSEKFNLFVKGLKPPKGEGIYNPVAESRQSLLKELAMSINAYLDAPWYSLGGSDAMVAHAALEIALEIPNNELYYLTKYYKSTYMKSLYKDLDEETMPSTWDVDVKLLQRLEELNLVD